MIREQLPLNRLTEGDVRGLWFVVSLAPGNPSTQSLNRREGFDDAHGFEADADDAPEQLHNVFRIVGAVGVGANAALLIFGHLVLVDHPFEGAAIAQAVIERLGRNPRQRSACHSP